MEDVFRFPTLRKAAMRYALGRCDAGEADFCGQCAVNANMRLAAAAITRSKGSTEGFLVDQLGPRTSWSLVTKSQTKSKEFHLLLRLSLPILNSYRNPGEISGLGVHINVNPATYQEKD
ncbi:hypothetical protein ACRALDRAFT_209915 [Sodiomyces alcalophilus JCM 7366]|uniref:uncharacterized protein n=1 Tax=Sodiomyces alcalophilus JCM 7366 TaxID=591952 RepID=UPI0039B3B6A0